MRARPSGLANLARRVFPQFPATTLIEAKLATRLETGGFSGINGVAAWMGWPDSPTYAERESLYLAEEIHTLDETLAVVETNRNRSLVLDTTGSVIYAGNNLLMRLRRHLTVLYLAASKQEEQLLIERYLNDPKPVLWRGAFQPKAGETPRSNRGALLSIVDGGAAAEL